ncbi:MAG TPA: alkaline phosphatase family protein [bacterium]|nr:alkaline phosphatase family protein [bacterium]HQL61614.1 alkaline phosphatase family protein [bacterium]
MRLFVVLLALVVCFPVYSQDEYPEQMALVMVWDGLRPDLVTPETTPTLWEFAESGMVFDNHHSVFPTVTRVNSAAVATGCYPGTNGILGNSIYAPEVYEDRELDTGDAGELKKYQKALGGSILTCPTLGDVLKDRNLRFAVASSGSTGSAFLLDANGAGVTVHYDYTNPETIWDEVIRRCGKPGPEMAPNEFRNAFAVRAYLDYLLPVVKPHVTLMWISDPDHTQHDAGVGAPETLRAIRLVDALFRTILDTLKARDLLERTTIIVASDHGFSSYSGGKNAVKALFEPGVLDGNPAKNIVMTGGAIYVRNGDKETIAKICKVLQSQPQVGVVFTSSDAEDGNLLGGVPGTFSFDAVHWSHPGAGAILFSKAWSDQKGPFGYPGTSANEGTAGHGTSSPFDIHSVLIMSGPQIRTGSRSTVPTANVDIAPTVCRIVGIEPPDYMDGRVIREAFEDGPHPFAVPYQTKVVRSSDGVFILRCSTVEQGGGKNSHYFDFAGRE